MPQGYMTPLQQMLARGAGPGPMQGGYGGGPQGPAGPAGQPGPTPGPAGNLGVSGSSLGGIAGMLGGAGLGVPGLGLVGTGIGTAVDVGSMSDTMSGMNEDPEAISFLPAFVNNLTFGGLGKGVQEQALEGIEANPATQAQAAQEAAVGLDAFGGAGQETGLEAFGGEGGDAGGGDGTVICTALYSHGLMSDDVYSADQEYGRKLWRSDPAVIVGYHLWAKPIAKFLLENKWAAQMIKPLVLPWANELAGKSSRLGRFYIKHGVPLCRWLGNRMLISIPKMG